MIHIGDQMRTTINHRRARVIIEARLVIYEHVCGRHWKDWEAYRVRCPSGRRTIKRASELKALKETTCN